MMTQNNKDSKEDNTKKIDALTKKARIAWATQVFERIKNGEKVAASDLERSSLILSESAQNTQESLGAWVQNQVELAEVLGVERKTIQRWLKVKGCPQARSDGRYNVAEFKDWASKTGRKAIDEDPTDERNKLEIRRLRTICERLDMELEIARGNYTPNDEVARQVYRMVATARKILGAMPSSLAPQVVGMTIPEAEKRIREQVDAVITQLHEKKWD